MHNRKILKKGIATFGCAFFRTKDDIYAQLSYCMAIAWNWWKKYRTEVWIWFCAICRMEPPIANGTQSFHLMRCGNNTTGLQRQTPQSFCFLHNRSQQSWFIAIWKTSNIVGIGKKLMWQAAYSANISRCVALKIYAYSIEKCRHIIHRAWSGWMRL